MCSVILLPWGVTFDRGSARMFSTAIIETYFSYHNGMSIAGTDVCIQEKIHMEGLLVWSAFAYCMGHGQVTSGDSLQIFIDSYTSVK